MMLFRLPVSIFFAEFLWHRDCSHVFKGCSRFHGMKGCVFPLTRHATAEDLEAQVELPT